MKENNESVFTLIKDHDTIKEAFIIDELQSYMDLKDPSNPKWVTPVRVRLQEKKDWETRVKEAINKVLPKGFQYSDGYREQLIKELRLKGEQDGNTTQMNFSIQSFDKRMSDPEYRATLLKYKKKHIVSIIEKYIKEKGLLKDEVTKMALSLKQEVKQKSNLNTEELQLLTKIANDKYSVGAFSGMIFNAALQYPEECPVKLVEKAVRTRKLIHDMAYQ